MKVVILGKRDQMGTMPMIRIKGMSRMQYKFLWDPQIRHYAYEPKAQREVDDIFHTQNRLYKTMRFSAWLNGDLDKKEKPDIQELTQFEEDATKPELLKKCRKLGLPVIPQDRPSSLKRLLKAYELGKDSS